MTDAHRFFRFAALATLICILIGVIRPALALEPDEILLITNKNSPDSQSLAKLYCQLRGVPADQVVTLDLPTAEEMPFETYETNVVGPTRKFLVDHQLKTKIKCLLTFYGVPFRILAKKNSPAEDRELAELKDLQGATARELQSTLSQFEDKAAAMNPTFKPQAGDTAAAVMARVQAAIGAVTAKIPSMKSREEQSDTLQQLATFLQAIEGEAEVDARLGPSQRNDPNLPEGQRQVWIDRHQRVLAAREKVAELQATGWDPAARDELRKLAHAYFGLIGLQRILDAEANYLTTDATGSATDNELALLWWDYYPRQRWLENPLNLAFAGRLSDALMTMRLDGPDPATVQQMMRTCVKVEKTGLDGIIAIDARGIAPIDEKGNLNEFGEFDETLRHLATMVRTKTKLKIAFDDQDIVFPPHYAKNVACYVGWYSVGQYIPGCDFVPGAIGYHVSSYEMLTLHAATAAWVRGLLKDGVVATMGACAEPYLRSFPKPDEFFPLLLTGKLTLAEVYWKTNPSTSWMISFIGDPLYSPYKVHPAMDVSDLPPGLRKAFP